MNTTTGKLNLENIARFDEHRSGWGFCMDSIASLHHPNGVSFDDFIERTFRWNLKSNLASGKLPYTRPWVGVLHNPHQMPDGYYSQDAPQSILRDPVMRESLNHCKGIYTLSDQSREWLSQQVSVPVESLTHTTETPATQFTWEQFEQNPRKKLIQVGVWLRRFEPFTRLNANGLQKVWLLTTAKARLNYLAECERLGIDLNRPAVTDVRQLRWVPHQVYDQLLSENLVYTNLLDSSANNLIVECIVRNTPILVNRLPAVVEYLGPDYPLFFDNVEGAGIRLATPGLIHDAHQYLVEMDKSRFAVGALSAQICQSTIYRNLPDPGSSNDTRPVARELERPEKNADLDNAMRLLRHHVDREGLRDPDRSTNSIKAESDLYRSIIDELLRDNFSNWNY